MDNYLIPSNLEEEKNNMINKLVEVGMCVEESVQIAQNNDSLSEGNSTFDYLRDGKLKGQVEVYFDREYTGDPDNKGSFSCDIKIENNGGKIVNFYVQENLDFRIDINEKTIYEFDEKLMQLLGELANRVVDSYKACQEKNGGVIRSERVRLHDQILEMLESF